MSYKDMTIKEFANILASKSSMPGGGTAAACLLSYAASLDLMVLNLSIGKEKFKEQESTLLSAKEKLETLKEDFLNFMDKDAENFKEMEKAYAMPKITEEEKEKKAVAMENACKTCCIVPKKVIEKAIEGLEISNSLYGITTKLAESDLVTAAIFYRAGIEASWQNVLINLKYIKDMKFIEEYDSFGKIVMSKIY